MFSGIKLSTAEVIFPRFRVLLKPLEIYGCVQGMKVTVMSTESSLEGGKSI
jgi:hypothetical protein